MDLFNEALAADLQNTRIKQFIESLSTLRTADESDVCLICQEKEFFAHKFVLQTASPYFATMFKIKMKEEKSGRVTFVDIECQTLEAILDFIYLGKVENVKTEEQYIKLLAASHLMELDSLFQYCCDSLQSSTVCLENFFEYFQLSVKYNSNSLLTKLYTFWNINSDILLNSEEFMRLSVLEVKSLINDMKRKKVCLDGAVGGVIKWLCHDLQEREKFAGELLNSVDGQLLSKEFGRSMFQKHDLIRSSLVISSLLKELSLISCTSHVLGKEHQILKAVTQEVTFEPWLTTLLFLSGECVVDVFETLFSPPVGSIIKRNCTQEFDLRTRTWLPVRYVVFDNNLGCYSQSNYCRRGNELYLFPKNGKNYAPCRYNTQKNSIYMCDVLPRETLPLSCRIFWFQSYLYKLEGATTALTRIGTSEILNSQIDVYWKPVTSLPLAVSDPTILTSSERLYVLGYNASAKDQLALQYTSDPGDGNQWQVICIRNKGLDPRSFFLANNTLNALSVTCTYQLLVYDHGRQTFAVKRTFNQSETSNLRLMWKLSKFQNPRCPFVFFSEKNDPFSIPVFAWEPESERWQAVVSMEGKRRIAQTVGLDPFYSFEQ